MLTYLYADQLDYFPALKDSMFRDRANQFKDRLEWDVSINEKGHELDAYDAMNPLYVIWKRPSGLHGGSMRFLPTTGNTMVNDVFPHIAGGEIRSPLIWESTRFCLAPDLGKEARQISAGLMLGGAEIGVNFGLRHAVGVFDPRMVRIYRMLGWAPEIVGEQGAGRDKICVGLWEFNETVRATIAQKAGIDLSLSAMWFEDAFNHAFIPDQAAVA